VARPELGTKRVCPVTGRKFYDLNKDVVISPYTGEVVPIVAPTSRGRAEPVRAAPIEEAEAPEVAEAELVSLEDADAEAAGGKVETANEAEEEDVELEQDDDATFLEPGEDEDDDDVADIIGGDIETEEET
jgi:uncharacterized protein (TIGR02300 family)